MIPHLRIARAVRDLEGMASLYREGLGLVELGRFEDHEGFDGVMLGHPGADHHLEFTRQADGPAPAPPEPEDLLVVYLPDAAAWQAGCARMEAAGFREVAAVNPYWNRSGRTFEDPEGHRVVLQQTSWPPASAS